MEDSATTIMSWIHLGFMSAVIVTMESCLTFNRTCEYHLCITSIQGYKALRIWFAASPIACICHHD